MVDQVQPADHSSGDRKAKGMACHAPAVMGSTGEPRAHVVRKAISPRTLLRTFCAQLPFGAVLGTPENP